MTPDEFKREMQRMSALRFYPASVAGHWEVVKDRVSLPILRAAVGRALTTRPEFPTPVELLQDADAVKHLAQPATEDDDRGVDLAEAKTFTVPYVSAPIRVTREWKYFCERCSDLGWASWWCGDEAERRAPWMELAQCGRYGVHGNHEFVAKCVCYENNPALIRKRENQGKFAAQEKSR